MNKEVVFISGASRGIGTAIAESFAKLGHTVIGTSRSEFKFESKQDNLIPLALDIANRDSINNCVEYLKDNNLKPSILVNNAGITSDQLFLRTGGQHVFAAVTTALDQHLGGDVAPQNINALHGPLLPCSDWRGRPANAIPDWPSPTADLPCRSERPPRAGQADRPRAGRRSPMWRPRFARGTPPGCSGRIACRAV